MSVICFPFLASFPSWNWGCGRGGQALARTGALGRGGSGKGGLFFILFFTFYKSLVQKNMVENNWGLYLKENI